MKKKNTKEFEYSPYTQPNEIAKLLQELKISLSTVTDCRLTELHYQSGTNDVNLLHFHEIALSEFSRVAPADEAIMLAMMLLEWARYRNSHFIDYVVGKLDDSGAAPTPLVWRIIAKLARDRLLGKEGLGGPKKVFSEIAKYETFNLMSKMRWLGFRLADAASKGARWMMENHPRVSLKASVLEREYSDLRLTDGRNGERSQEELLFLLFDRRYKEAAKTSLYRELSALPEADDLLKGNRRQ